MTIEGFNGGGKSTQAKLLCEKMRNDDIKAGKVSFLDYS